jgi:hypothetical protein
MFVSLSLVTSAIFAQTSKIDSVAVTILDQMSHIIGDLTSVSFTVRIRSDVYDSPNELISNFSKNKVIFDGPDKMLIQSKGDKGQRGFWYNGKLLVYYSHSENNYAVIDAPATTIETIDSINTAYSIDFPAADFFYSTFTDDLLETSDELIYNGIKEVEEKECFHIISHQKEMSIQIWIENNALFLPVKMLIVYKGKNQGLQYEATFIDWQINPVLPASMFEFLPPPGAREVKILAKSK